MNLLTDVVPLEENALKVALEDIKNGSKIWEEENAVIIVKSMMEHIGTTDSELRDQLIYSSFYQFILEKNYLNDELLIELLDMCLNDLLMKGLGENGTDTVFTRSFTSLLIGLILGRDNKNSFLSQSTVYKVKDELIDYMNAEKDLRGYVSGKGWAHSVAHVSDVFDELIKNPNVNQELYFEILTPLWNKVFVSESVYIHDEDERILTPILEMLHNGLELKEIEYLIQNIPSELGMQKQQLEEEQYWMLVANCKKFLKSFYVKVSEVDDLIPLQKSIAKCLSEIFPN
ncbi:DUF2785 domain-containing protein [Psychrobacillus sp.]|uniref:DUF2785 domain-containing protein n=1 Tax=Psychrobacillus sp. TaxID=1871623 RepID=UPI0028BDCEB8|nr:DUF2785 domain-containing protein [Psychrobacillus sp.]